MSYVRQSSFKRERDPVAVSLLKGRLQRSPTIGYVRGVQRTAAKGEIKAVDVSQANYALDTSGTVTCLSLANTGTSFFNRIGRRIKLASVQITGNIANTGATATAGVLRIIIVYDKQSNGALPSYADVITSVVQAGTTTSGHLDGPNQNNRDRFKILVDRKIHVPTVTTSVANGFPSPDSNDTRVHIYKRLNHTVQFKGDTNPTTIADISTGSLIMLTVGPGAPGTAWTMTASIRTKFYDV